MPVYIVCSNCGYPLYICNELTTPEEVVRRIGGRCPRCLSRLETKPKYYLIQVRKRRNSHS